MRKKLPEKIQSLLYLNTIVQITDKDEVLIENCKRLAEYNDIFLKIITNNMTVQIWGSGLKINNYGTSSIIVKGVIDSVEILKSKNR
ncbi:MAG: YabP/YqfC family sporulation protein [Oscillospiraceae bacterium]|nr:YabP/YqfC family sporulation protein [Oscillospiraceae bacterium]